MKKILFCSFLFVVCVCIFFNATSLLTGYAGLFSVHNAKPGADALVVLGGRIETRFPHALELYRQGYADKILLTDLRPYTLGIPDFDCSERAIARAQRDFFEPGAPVIVVPSRSGRGCVSTFDEAWDLLAYSQSKGYARIIIVTDAFHTRRSRYAFDKVFQGSGIVVETMGAPNAVFNERNWWRSDSGLKSYLLEPLLLTVYFFTSSNVSFLENY
jgi:uncharacterized SAM-binding protein YcdF (DUF218 family)